jgi:hypothetical protein
MTTTYNYTILDYPSPYRPFAQDINNAGQIVGNNNAGQSWVYTINNGTFTPVPSYFGPELAFSINDAGANHWCVVL